MKWLIRLLATFFGLGYLPLASGTWGTVGGVLLYWVTDGRGWWVRLLIFLIVFLLGIPVAEYADRSWGTHDNKRIVIDEVAGYLLGVLPFSFTIERAIIGFILFRFFDITKIYPAGTVDKKVGGGAGVMLDDIVAGFYSLIVMFLIVKFAGG